jgi:DNA-binding NarL/FixJ family response regulator
MEGYTNQEIAEKLECVEESVRRKVMLIRSIWSNDNGL